jgi:hypothetical protein
LNNLPVENPVRFSKGRMDAGIRRMIGGERELRYAEWSANGMPKSQPIDM